MLELLLLFASIIFGLYFWTIDTFLLLSQIELGTITSAVCLITVTSLFGLIKVTSFRVLFEEDDDESIFSLFLIKGFLTSELVITLFLTIFFLVFLPRLLFDTSVIWLSLFF